MGSMNECRIEGFICRLCSQIDRNVIHIYSDEGLQKKLEQKINVYLKISLTRHDLLPKAICVPCDAKLEQHHKFIQRVIQNQKKIQGERLGERPIIPLLEQHLRVRVSPVVREDGSGSNTYNIEAISGSDSESIDSTEGLIPPESSSINNSNEEEAGFSDMEGISYESSETSSDSSLHTATEEDYFVTGHAAESPPQIVNPSEDYILTVGDLLPSSRMSSSDYSHDEDADSSYNDSDEGSTEGNIQLDDSDGI